MFAMILACAGDYILAQIKLLLFKTTSMNQNISKLVLSIAILCLSTINLEAASRYWVSSTSSNWNNTANWSTTSGGSGGASVPTSADYAYFNGASGKNGDCSVDAAVDLSGFSMSGYTGTITNTSYDVTINGGNFTQSTGTFNMGSGNFSLSSQVNMTGGTFHAGSGSYDINNYFNFSAGTFTATSGTMYVGSAWAHTSGGTFNHNNGTVEFDGTGNRQLQMVSNLETFYNVTFNKASNGMVGLVSTGDKMVVENDLVFNNGYVSSWSNNAVSIEVQGDATVNSTFLTIYNALSLVFTGSNNQNFDLTGATDKINYAIKFNKSSGTVTMLSDCMLDGGSGATFTSGTLDLNGYTFTNQSYQSFCDGTFTLTGTGTLSNYGWTQTSASANFTNSGSNTFIVSSGHFNVSNGTFSGGSATIDMNGHMQLTGGTFNGTSGTMTLSRDWAHTTSGTFNHNNGTIVLDGAFTSPPGKIRMLSNTETFYNLTMNLTSGSQVLYNANDNMVIAGDLTLTKGTLSTWNGGDQVTTEVKGNVTVASTFGSSSADNTIKFTGTASTQNFDLTGAPTKILGNIIENKASGEVKLLSAITIPSGKSFTVTSGILGTNGYNMTLNGSSVIQTGATLKIQGTETIGTPTLNSGSSVIYTGRNISETITIKDHGATDYYNLTIDDQNTNQATFSLSNNLTVTNLLTMTNGVLNAGTYVLSLGGVTGTNGEVNNTLTTLNAPSSQDLGTLGFVLTSSANLGSTTIKLGFTPIEANGNSGIRRYYHLVPTTNTGLNATVVFNYWESELNGITESNLVLFESSNGTSWTTLSSSLDSDNNKLTETGFNSLNYLTAGSSASPLPVSLLFFKADRVQDDVKLSWATASEHNNDFFTIERSFDGRHFENNAIVSGSGNSERTLEYGSTDFSVPATTVYYRLRQTDFNGDNSISSIIVLEPILTKQILAIYTSSASDMVNVSYVSNGTGRRTVLINDISGNVIIQKDIVVQKEMNNLEFNTVDLPTGIYILSIGSKSDQETTKFVVRH